MTETGEWRHHNHVLGQSAGDPQRARKLADEILQLAWTRFAAERVLGHGQSWCRDVWEQATALATEALRGAAPSAPEGSRER